MINRGRLLKTFLELVAIPSPSGTEKAVAEAIAAKLQTLGLEVKRDLVGNILTRLEGQGEPLLLTAHMDTVGPCERVTPVVEGDTVRSDGSTILGADDKSGVAVILEVLAVLKERALPHRPLEVLFTVEEETGLGGAKGCDLSQLRARMGIGLDAGGEPGTIVVSAPSHDELWAQIHGRAAHAGVSPEQGISAIQVAAEAIAAMPLGRIDEETTANIGTICGGSATNVVPELLTLQGEARSRNELNLQAQTRAMVEALEHSAAAHSARAEIKVTRLYTAYTFDENTPVVQLVSQAMRSVGMLPLLQPTGGGSDANVFNAEGMSVVQISAGMHAVHTSEERASLAEMLATAQIIHSAVRGR